ncbi:hypothetical protein [Buttiauxella noackiae]|uniref:hypothetical protein n=1 Tax=Buttiauxella noackiae TaxID=82992 RepID=UPI0005524A27|nr:hypothetical protein [Buttiauxella noackiae]
MMMKFQLPRFDDDDYQDDREFPFVIYESPSMTGVTRVVTLLNADGKHLNLTAGCLVDADCIPVTGDLSRTCGISLCEVSPVTGLTTEGDFYGVYIRPTASHHVYLDKSYFTSRQREALELIGFEFKEVYNNAKYE